MIQATCRLAAFILLMLGNALCAFAQPSMGVATLPTVGLRYTKVGYDTTSFNPGPGGADVVWDFSTLAMRTDSVLVRVIGPTEFTTKQRTLFPNAQLGIVEDTTFRAYETTPTVFRQHGLETPKINTVVATTNPFDTRPADITFNKPFTDTYNAVTNVVGSPVPLQETGSVNLVYDGYGTLKLRGNTFTNVGRISAQQTVIDTLKLPGPTPTTFVIRTVTLSATWYESTSAVPIFTIGSVSRLVLRNGETIEGPIATRFSYGRRTVADTTSTSVEETVITSSDLSPNPVQAGALVTLPLQGSEPVTVVLMDVVGRQTVLSASTMVPSAEGLGVRIPSVPPGMYSIVATSASNVWQFRCVVQ
ncbi:MAG: hypothetical protein JSS89_10930 [Bacteroidetes bacterium]|nr:hypothetical protein [Bacteroidota bacterium]